MLKLSISFAKKIGVYIKNTMEDVTKQELAPGNEGGGVFYTLSKQRIFPEAMLRICPGYRPADNGEPVAPGKASAATGEPSAESLKFPEAVLGAFTGDRRKKPAR